MPLQNAAASITGIATTNFHSSDVDKAGVASVGAAILFIDPTKVLLSHFFGATTVPTGTPNPTVPQVRVTPAGQVPQKLLISSATSGPPKTKLGGIPNEG